MNRNNFVPAILALIGLIIGVAALFISSDTRATAAFGLSGSAIAAAAGLAQPSDKNDRNN